MEGGQRTGRPASEADVAARARARAATEWRRPPPIVEAGPALAALLAQSRTVART
jgi:hypothetical protein